MADQAICPYCASADSCEHHLLSIEVSFREAAGGPLFDWFREAWSAVPEDDEDFDEAEAFDALREKVESVCDAQFLQSFEEGGPGQSSMYEHFYCSTAARVEAAVARLDASNPSSDDSPA